MTLGSIRATLGGLGSTLGGLWRSVSGGPSDHVIAAALLADGEYIVVGPVGRWVTVPADPAIEYVVVPAVGRWIVV